MLVPVAEFARSHGKSAATTTAGAARTATLASSLKATLMASAVLLAFPLAAQAQATSFLDFTTLDGWTTKGGTTLSTTTDSFNIGGKAFSLAPAAGNSMVRITPTGSNVVGAAAADAALGLNAGTVASVLGANTTNFGYISKTFSFNPGTYSFAWAYAAKDYQPYNDGVLFALSGNGVSNLVSLARNGKNATDTSGPQDDTLVLGSYGSTAWITTSFTIANAGDYLVSYADYNWNDQGQDPVYYLSGVAGSFTGQAIGSSGPAVISGNTPANASGITSGTVAPAFDGGTLTMDGNGASFAQNFTITDNGGAIEQNGKESTFSGVISNSNGAGTLHIVNGSNGGSVTLSGANTYTGATDIGSGGTLALAGNGSIASSSEVINNGVLDISASAGANVKALSGSGSTVLGDQQLTITNATGDFGGNISGNGALAINGGAQQLSGVNGYTGATGIGSGATLFLSGTGSIASSSQVVNDGVLDIGATQGASLVALSGSGSTVLGDQQLTITVASGDFAGNIAGNGGLAISGGAQTLSGANAYTGATGIATGAKLALSGNGSVAASSAIVNNGEFDISATAGSSIVSLAGSGNTVLGAQTLSLTGANGSFDGTIAGSGNIAIDGGALQLSNISSYTGATGIANGAKLALSGNGSVASSSIIVNNGEFDIGATAGSSIVALSGTGSTLLGAQTLTLTGANGSFDGTIAGSGGVNVAGGALSLTNANTFTGITTVGASGSIVLNGAGSLAASSKILNNGKLVFAGNAPAIVQNLEGAGQVELSGQDLVLTKASGIIGGAISGNGKLNLKGGSTTLAGLNTFIGAVNISNGGQLQIGADSALGNAANSLNLDNGALLANISFNTTRAITLTNTGSIGAAEGTTLALQGTLGGNGQLLKQGGGNLVLSGNNIDFSGGASINGGTLTLASSKAIGGGKIALNAGTLASTVNLALAQDFSVTGGTSWNTAAGTTALVTGNIMGNAGGDGCFVKAGAGTLNLAGNSTIGSGVCVQNGELRANGSLNSSALTVASGGTLRGSGTISAPVTVLGKLAPGNSPGTLTSTGSVTMTAGSTFQEDINGTGTASGPGNYSRLLLTGTASFNAGGATLAPNLTAITGSDAYTAYVPVVGDQFRIVTAAGGISGRFGALAQPTGLQAGTRMAVFYNINGSNSIDLLVLPSSYAGHVQTAGGNRNAQAVGGVADALIDAENAGTASAAQSAMAYGLARSSAQRVTANALGLSGEVHSAMAAAAPLAGQSLQGTLVRHLGGQAQAGVDGGIDALWVDLKGQRSEWSSDNSASSFTANRGQLTIGLDALRTRDTRIGAGFSRAQANLGALDGSGDLDENIAFVYGEHSVNGVRIDAMAGAGHSQWDTRRADALGAGQLRSAADGKSVMASIGASFPRLNAAGDATPFVRLAWQRVERDAASEGTAIAALGLDGYRASGTRAVAGVSGDLLASLHYSVGLGLDSGDLLRPSVGARLAGIGMQVAAPQVSRVFGQFGVAGNAKHSERTSSFYGVNGEVRDGRTDLSLSGGVQVSF